MSAYVVEDKTINTIIGWFREQDRHETIKNYQVRQLIKNLYFKTWEKGAKKLFNLNVGAVCQRYKDDKPSDYSFQFQITPVTVNQYQILKSLQCFLYQCSEGNADETKLYKQLREIEHAIALMIATSSQQYEMANWG